jgi:hypothetical protein
LHFRKAFGQAVLCGPSVQRQDAIPITYPDVVVDVIEQAARATTK